jgi:hypothetical protein
MGKLNLAQIQPEMVLAADVLDRNGRVLLKAGLAISEKHLKILQQWGVTEADIKDVSREDVNSLALQELDPEAHARAEAHYRELFRCTPLDNPIVQEMFRLSVLRAACTPVQGVEHDH